MSGPVTWCEGCGELAREIEALKDEVAFLRIAHDRADGALADASTVPTGNPERGIRALTAERDRFRAEGERLYLGLARMQKIAATVDADLRARTAERDGLVLDVKALAEALEESESLVSEIHDRVWAVHEINRAALARDGVRRGRGETG